MYMKALDRNSINNRDGFKVIELWNEIICCLYILNGIVMCIKYMY